MTRVALGRCSSSRHIQMRRIFRSAAPLVGLLGAIAGSATPASAEPIANPTLQRCIGTAPDQPRPQRIGPSPATMAFCRQLPGWEPYEQAGQRFNAGDRAGGVRLVTQAAEAGNPLAQLRLAMLYEAGDGVARSKPDALTWYRRAASQGEPGAEAELGGYYEEGDGVPDDWVEAAAWYRRSAEQGWMKGQLALGRAYQYGIGVPLDLGLAITWYDRAAAQGHPNAGQLAQYLRDNHGHDGSSRNEREQAMLGPLVQRTVLTLPPVGRTFHNSAERYAYIQAQAQGETAAKARAAHEMRKSAYDDCRRAGREGCGADPGPAPR